MNTDNKTVMVIKHSLAKKLLQRGYQIIDLQPKQNQDGSTDYTRAVYIFQYKSGIHDDIQKLK